MPAEASDGERNFVFIARKYIAMYKPDSIKSVSLAVMKDNTKTDTSDTGSSPASAPIAAPVVSDQETIISDQAAFNEWFSKLAGPTGRGRIVITWQGAAARRPSSTTRW